MNGYFLNMNPINIGKVYNPKGHISDILLILHKYYYSNTYYMLDLMNEIRSEIDYKGVDISINHSSGKMEMNIKIPKGFKKYIKKKENKDISVDYFYNILKMPIHNFLTKIQSSFADTLNKEYAGREVPPEFLREIYEEFTQLALSEDSSNILIHIVSLLDGDNFIVVQFI